MVQSCCWGVSFAQVQMLRSSLPLSVLGPCTCASSFHRWSGSLLSGVGSPWSLWERSVGAERLPIWLCFPRGNVPVAATSSGSLPWFSPSNPACYQSINNSTSFETLPPMFGSLLGKQRCLHSDISWCEVLTGTRCHQVCHSVLTFQLCSNSRAGRAVCYHFVGK